MLFRNPHIIRVLNAAYVAPRVRAQLDVVLKLSLEREDVFAKGLQRDLRVKATECADVDGLVSCTVGRIFKAPCPRQRARRSAALEARCRQSRPQARDGRRAWRCSPRRAFGSHPRGRRSTKEVGKLFSLPTFYIFAATYCLVAGWHLYNTGKKCKRKTRLQHSPRHDRFKSVSAPTLDRETEPQRWGRKAYSRARARQIHSG